MPYNFFSKSLQYSLYFFAFSLPLSKAFVSIFFGSSVIFFILKKITHFRERWFSPTPIDKSILYFLIFCGLSLLWSNYFPTNLQGLFKYMRNFFLIYLILDAFKTPREGKKLILFLLLGGLTTSFNGIFQYYYGVDLIQGETFSDRILSSFNDPNTLAAYLALILPLSLLPFNNKNLKKNTLYLLVFCTLLFTFLLCFTRNIFYFLFLSIAFIFLYQVKHLSFYKIFLAMFLVMAFLAFIKPSAIRNLPTSFAERFYLWKISFKMIQDKPLLGHGLNSYSKINMKYFPKDKKDMPYSAEYLHLAYPHNGYLKIWIEAGLIGLFLYLNIYLILFKYLLLKLKQPFLTTRARYKLSLCTISILAFIMACFFDTFLESTQTRFTFWLIVGLLMVELRSVRASEADLGTNVSKDPVAVPQT
ncbi:MAG: hypothetical protein A3G92_07500 [Deltaproteobacteria bacterium RIFCSPLOWO2_12_FULL_38_8]|nr:MAG: hypothetical protein A3G92_07500 [Deltaproteobacteria bacterium RIFCSPLOWO2_12_FULL_38_8]